MRLDVGVIAMKIYLIPTSSLEVEPHFRCCSDLYPGQPILVEDLTLPHGMNSGYSKPWQHGIICRRKPVIIPVSAACCISYEVHIENLCVAGSSEKQIHREKNKNNFVVKTSREDEERVTLCG